MTTGGGRPQAGAVTVPAQRPVPPTAPERRGRTEVADRVVAKLACRAAMEVPEVRGVRLKGVPFKGRPGDGGLWGRTSSAEVHGDRATVHLAVGVAYPAPLRAVGRRLREHVIRRVAAQTGVHVSRLDITMTDVDGELP
ncbi:Asp23/Gls24 family envelope stress response protein [Nonomuraea sp. B12E4]|uniref:Asp23/Gls24 family envelope stress response protein n=1 Tax=Nonomuraea sp. B12E4 TaxID=3153564 RepID=UPI00325F6130